MKGFFQRLKSGGRPAAEAADAQLVLAAFGKHPGWDDHMPGIGVKTDALAYVKQTLYVGGIGRQIDSGAWEKLEADKRLDGFDHMFLWQRAGDVLLGELWSSTDRKGRSKYPMVLCVDGANVSPDFLLDRAAAELPKLRERCKSVDTAEQVASECQAAQERLSRSSLSGGPKSESITTAEVRRKFLESQDAGPDKVGLLRVLHELRRASANGPKKTGTQANGGNVRCHLRVPVNGHSNVEAFALWSAFFQSAVPKGTSVLLIFRKTVNWMDAIIGEPESDDFFCLGAGLKALPLTTEIPYDLPPELKAGLEKVESGFLGAEVAKSSGGQSVPASSPSVGGLTSPPAPQSSKKSNWIVPLMLLGVVLAATAAFFLFQSSRHSNAPVAVTESSPPAGTNKPLIAATNAAPANVDYDGAIKDCRTAMDRRDYAVAVAKADAALRLRQNDVMATELKAQAQAGLRQADAARTLADSQYQHALESAQQAFAQSNYGAAISQAEAALRVKSNDPSALKLRTDAKAQMDLMAIVASQAQQKYDAAMASAQAAFGRGDFSNAVAFTDTAMSFKSNDATASKLKATIQAAANSALMDAQRQRDYLAAMNDAHTAFQKKDFATAIAKADQALRVRANDAAATKIEQDAKAAVADAELASQLGKVMSSAQAAYDASNYAGAMAQANEALKLRPGFPAAAALLIKATESKDLLDARFYFDGGDFDKVKVLCTAHAGNPVFDDLAGKVKAVETNELDVKLEGYLVLFGLLDPKNAKSSLARKTKPLSYDSNLPMDYLDQKLKEIASIKTAFQAAGRLDSAHKSQLDALEKAIKGRY